MASNVDFHTHVLPRVDDGSQSIADSVAMLRMEAEQGIRHVVATPHFYPQNDTPEKFLRRREAAIRRLREEMAKYDKLPRISVGAEVYFFPGISRSDILPELTIAGKPYILIEMPMAHWSSAMYRELEAIPEKTGLTPVIAHVDRYIGPFRTYGIPEQLAELPVLVQANGSFFQHFPTRGLAMQMLTEGRIHLLGSDCHNLTDRKPNLGQVKKLIRSKLGGKALEYIGSHERLILG